MTKYPHSVRPALVAVNAGRRRTRVATARVVANSVATSSGGSQLEPPPARAAAGPDRGRPGSPPARIAAGSASSPELRSDQMEARIHHPNRQLRYPAGRARHRHQNGYTALLPIIERVSGPEHPDTLTDRASLAHWTKRAAAAG
jgi:hypothetical protein